jgi:hypothetical protein
MQHPIQQRFGRRRGDAGSLQLPNLTSLAVDLNAHTLDLGPNVFNIRHGAPFWNGVAPKRTNHERDCKRLGGPAVLSFVLNLWGERRPLLP